MKNQILLLLALLISVSAFSQKKNKDSKEAPKDSVVQVADTSAAVADTVAKAAPAVMADTTAPVAQTDSAVAKTTAQPAATETKPAAASTAPASTSAPAALPPIIPYQKPSGSPEIDSLNKVITTLNAKLNTANKETERYQAVYTVIKDKVLKYDFEPERMTQIIDSLAARKDSSALGSAATFTALRDSLISVKEEITQLKEKLAAADEESARKIKLAAELKMLKDLLDARILTQTEFDTKKILVLEKWK